MNQLRLAVRSAPRRLAGVGLVVFAAACHHAAPPPAPAPAPARPVAAPARGISSGSSLLQAMHERYAGTWYKTLTFTQRTTTTLASGGDVVQTWYEAGAMPGRLRIDVDLKSKTGYLFRNDSIYTFSGGKLVKADTGVNDLLVLGFDVYAQPPATTGAVLRKLGFDFAHFRESTWQGKPVYIVGAAPGDTTSHQFWIDRETLLFVRLIKPSRTGRTDIRFQNYVQSGGGWVAEEVLQYVNGKRVVREEYSDVRTNVPLADALFDPRQWSTVPHWR